MPIDPAAPTARPDLLVVGHVTMDITPRGHLPGGVAYAALTALRLGRRVGVVTSAGPDVDVGQLLPGAWVACVPASQTTVFQNRYHGLHRQQTLHQRASFLSLMAIPAAWRRTPMVLLCPVAQEMRPRLSARFPRSLVAVEPQGWLRRWDQQGSVVHEPATPHNLGLHGDIAVLSREEVPEDRLDAWREAFSILVVTRGEKGADLYYQNEWTHVPAFPVPAVDPTGAGDVFATAFLLRYAETRDPVEAGRFASCAASFCVQAWGLEGVPTEAQIRERLQLHPGL